MGQLLASPRPPPIKGFDLRRYLGLWYELARYDHRFERGLDACTAEYSLNPDGTVKVVNRGYRQGQPTTVTGSAYVPDPGDPSKLKVSFFWFFYADYFVLDIDPEYTWAIVGSSGPGYLWVLSRSPKVSEEVRSGLVKSVEAKGYDPSRLIWVRH